MIGDYDDPKTKKNYKNLLYQIRPAFGGNIIATIVNPDHRPQMATVREGVMKKDIFKHNYSGKIININVDDYLNDTDFVVKIIERHIEANKIDIKKSSIIVAGGYGVGSKENFNLLFELADVLGGEVGASRAAVDAGYVDHDRQVGQTGITVRPKLYISCGISGQIQHRSGMEESAIIVSINNDPEAPINSIADYVINGDVADVLPKMIKYYKKNSK
jgi:electron transfer flavoprotein alpha subunit